MFKSRFAAPLLLLSLLGFSGCVNFDATVTVPEGTATKLEFNDRGSVVAIPPGQYDVQFHVADHAKDLSELRFKALGRKFSLHLPDAREFLNVNKPLELSPESLGQPFALQITRVTDLKKDHYGVTFLSADRQEVLGTAQFSTKGGEVAYDAKNKEFLQSFQKVRHSQRGTVIPIASRVSPIIDHLAQVYIAPWIYARYSNVQWIVNGSYWRRDGERAKWSKVLKSSPVVDLFLFNHEGDDIGNLDESRYLGWKKHQLRLLYTEGCDSASRSYFQTFMSRYNAAVAIGHRGTSASPFVAFPLVRFWTYGSSALASTRRGWAWGGTENALIDYLSFTALSHSLWRSHAQMLHETEPGVEWTSEMPPEKLFIDQSAVVNRDTVEKRVWNVSFIRTFGKDVTTGNLDPNDSLFNGGVESGADSTPRAAMP